MMPEAASLLQGTVSLRMVMVVAVIAAMAFWLGYRDYKIAPVPAPAVGFPWSALLRPGHTPHIVASDHDFAGVQDITHHQATLSDYAGGKYIPDAAHISPEFRNFALK